MTSNSFITKDFRWLAGVKFYPKPKPKLLYSSLCARASFLLQKALPKRKLLASSLFDEEKKSAGRR